MEGTMHALFDAHTPTFPTIYIEDVTRRCEEMNFIFEWKTIFDR